VQSRLLSTWNVTDEMPAPLVAEAVVVTIPHTVVLGAGVTIETLGPVPAPPPELPPSAAVTPALASSRPQPKIESQPAAPRSSADCFSMLITLAGVSDGFAENISAATPAVSGAENDVPHPAP
jgi:hypothetical protein